MRCPSRPARIVLRIAVVAGLLPVLVGCSAGPDVAPSTSPASSAGGGQADPVLATTTTVRTVVGTGPFTEQHRARLKIAVAAAVDAWIDAAYLGSYPRTDFADAYPTFTAGAARRAAHDGDLMSNASIGADLADATAVKRRLRLDVLLVKGTPTGVTARFAVGLELAMDDGSGGRRDRVTGHLFLTHQSGSPTRPGRWRIFGYDVQRGAV